MKEVPCQWDFPGVTPEDYRLPEVKVGRWGGFVFINPAPRCGLLASYLGDLPKQFALWPLEQRFKQAHVAKILRCNWKVAQEAFMEAYHVVATHPQIPASIGYANSQYDVWGNFSRAITPNATPSPHLKWQPTEQEMLDVMMDRNLDDPPLAAVPDPSLPPALRALARPRVVGRLAKAQRCPSISQRWAATEPVLSGEVEG